MLPGNKCCVPLIWYKMLLVSVQHMRAKSEVETTERRSLPPAGRQEKLRLRRLL